MQETWYAMRSDSEAPAGDGCCTAETAAEEYWSDMQWDAEYEEPPETVTVVRAVFHTYTQDLQDTVGTHILYWQEGERRVMPRPTAEMKYQERAEKHVSLTMGNIASPCPGES